MYDAPSTVYDLSGHKFTGKERDSESGLDNFGERYFGSSFGRFMRPDPSSVGGDIVDSERRVARNTDSEFPAALDRTTLFSHTCESKRHGGCPRFVV
jgi:RHS repeat-associated protein